METESVRSGRSERSERSQRSRKGNRPHRPHQPLPQTGPYYSNRQDIDEGSIRDDRSVTISVPHSRVMGRAESGAPGVSMISRPIREGNDRIEVQIVQQDDNWPDNTTAITSETGFSMDDMARLGQGMEDSVGFTCARYLGTVFTIIFSILTILSPVAMLVLPKLNVISGWETDTCNIACEGLFISFAFKLVVLIIGTWALLWRTPKATLPRMNVLRAFTLFLASVLIFAFWLFYGVRIVKKKEPSYDSIARFSSSLVDALLFLHYASLILLKIKHMTTRFVVHVVRSPDGVSKCYPVGDMSIQRLAVAVLENYLRDFEVYNPYLELVTSKRSRSTSYKVYNVDGPSAGDGALLGNARPPPRRETGHNERFHDEIEYEKKVRKRKARLIAATEEAFTHIKRLQLENSPAIPMDPSEAAQAIFPSMARSLQKFLRVTRQQPRYTMESILQHLALCIGHDMGPKAFLERYLTQGSIIMNDKEYKKTQNWILICDQLLSRGIEHGTMLQLRYGDVALMVNVRRLPHFNLTEEVIDPKCNKFVMRLNSETSV